MILCSTDTALLRGIATHWQWIKYLWGRRENETRQDWKQCLITVQSPAWSTSGSSDNTSVFLHQKAGWQVDAVQMVLITAVSVLCVHPKHKYSKGADGPLGIKSMVAWAGELANRTRAGLPEWRWIIAQAQTCWKILFRWSNFTHYYMQDVPVTAPRVKIPHRGGRRGGANKWVVMWITHVLLLTSRARRIPPA